MTVVGQEFLAGFLMTFQACSHFHLGRSLMAGAAIFDIGLMEEISNETFLLTAVRVVTGEAAFKGQRILFMGPLQFIFFRMAGKTECIGFVGEQLQIVGLMRPVAACTVTLRIGFMGLFVLLLQVRMTCKAVLGKIFAD